MAKEKGCNDNNRKRCFNNSLVSDECSNCFCSVESEQHLGLKCTVQRKVQKRVSWSKFSMFIIIIVVEKVLLN